VREAESIESVCAAIAARCARREISPAIALMEMLIASEDLARVRAAVAASGDAALAALLVAHEAGAARVATMLGSDVDVPPHGGSVEDGVAFCKHLFDWSVRQSEEASVALYSLGSPVLLEAATGEIVHLLETWGLLGPHRRALDIGCGIGRMEVALAACLGRIDAIDVSEGMIEAAGRRCAALANVHLALASGLDLAMFEDDTFDLALAVDTFPYLVQSGMPLAATHIAEAARVLVPRGDLVLLNFSYRDDTARDVADVAALAHAARMKIVSSGTRPFALWNGVAFHLRRGA
jgi:SAM-dependent methyltransferase